jgi:hypothetical protein
MTYDKKYRLDFIFANGEDNFAMVEEAYCFAQNALPMKPGADGLSFRDIWMSGVDDKNQVVYTNDDVVRPMVLQAVCAELLAEGIDPGQDEGNVVNRIVEYIANGDDAIEDGYYDLAYRAAKRVGLGLAIIGG